MLCPNHQCLRSWNWPVLWGPTTSSRMNTKKRCPFNHRGLECKSRKSRGTQYRRQLWPSSTKWSKAKSNRVLSGEHAGHSKHTFQQPKRWIYTWTSPNVNDQIDQMVNIKIRLCSLQPEMEKLYTVIKNKTWNWLWLKSWAPYCKTQG